MGTHRWTLGLCLVVGVSIACGESEPAAPRPPAPPVPPVGPVASVILLPANDSIAPNGTLQLTAVLKDSSGVVLTDRATAWTTSAESVAAVSATGLVTGAGLGTATIMASAEGMSGAATITVIYTVASVTVTPANDTLAEGETLQLEAVVTDATGAEIHDRPVTWTSSNPGLVSTTGLFTAKTPGRVSVTASVEGMAGSAKITTAVAFANVQAAVTHSCGLKFNGRAYCWGDNSYSELGTGAISFGGPVPVAVRVPQTLTDIAVGSNISERSFTCVLANDGVASCWGASENGQTGTGATNFVDLLPEPVAGNLSFRAMAAGGAHACGLTTSGAAYCWGDNSAGQLGTGDSASQAAPVPVAGSLNFASITAGLSHTCAVTPAGVAYCWGANGVGELGDGTTSPKTIPTAVAGGHTFVGLSAGVSTEGAGHTCGIVTGGQAFCWGKNFLGQLGSGVAGNPGLIPTLITGGHTWRSLSAGGEHTCGVTTAGSAMCWGLGQFGELGTGTMDINPHPAPEPVIGGHSFSAIRAGSRHTCAIESTHPGITYCWGRDGSGRLGSAATGPVAVPTIVLGFGE